MAPERERERGTEPDPVRLSSEPPGFTESNETETRRSKDMQAVAWFMEMMDSDTNNLHYSVR